jgi:NAD(P)-dependent dehydrogenase (short-subunit alcohol dehydrogenase family)
MGKQVWVVTGASRGIGLALCRKLLALGQDVVGACRNPDGARELWELKSDYKDRFRYLKLDVQDQASVDAFAAELRGQVIDVVINNAGVLRGGQDSFEALRFDDMMKSFDVNTLGPMRVTRALLSNLRGSSTPKVINITSKMGSISDNTSGGYYAYRMSKTALNMFNQSFTVDFPQITSIVMHPGWVKTEMGGASAPTDADESAGGIVAVAQNLTKAQRGQFLDFKGQEIRW